MTDPDFTFANFVQLAYTTNDFDQALEVMHRRHGIPKFMELRGITIETGANESATMNIALALVDDVQIEILQGVSGDNHVYIDGFRGEDFQLTFHHICQRVKSLEEFDRLLDRAIAFNRPIALKGTSTTGAHYAYVDVRSELGHYIEYLYREPADEERFMASVPRYHSA